MSRFWENLPWNEDEANRQSEQQYEPDFTQGSWYNIPYQKRKLLASPPTTTDPPPSPHPPNNKSKNKKAAKKAYRREQREDACKEKASLDHMDRSKYLKIWQAADRAAYGTAYDEFSTSAEAFLADHTKAFPQLKKHGCERKNCVKATLLGVCHHEVEAILG
ncbi:hypothetical protein DID88_000404 [Monilinia fructigena]|uniref:Uncharacterized protein n=1 Tax=Monilinia fructigena TaxID=38457 RepID=A0A395IHG9_9HELO|nr:hypothetical protein DID88_000404 [Monilinia fructigena]